MSKRNDVREREMLDFIREYIRKEGFAPTTDTIADALGCGKATVSKYVTRLIEVGELVRHTRYGLALPDTAPNLPRMPIVGSIACGKPKLAREDIEGYITADPEIVGVGDFIALIADGDSMIDAGIDDGDIVYVRRQASADDGEIVACLTYDGVTDTPRATLKRFYRDPMRRVYILHPENERLDDIVTDNVEIIGVVTHILKKVRKFSK